MKLTPLSPCHLVYDQYQFVLYLAAPSCGFNRSCSHCVSSLDRYLTQNEDAYEQWVMVLDMLSMFVDALPLMEDEDNLSRPSGVLDLVLICYNSVLICINLVLILLICNS